jgi:predicted kinase
VLERGRRADDASEATLEVLQEQLQAAEPLCGEEQAHAITIETPTALARSPS